MVALGAVAAWAMPVLYLAAAGVVRLGPDADRGRAWAEVGAAAAMAAGVLSAGVATLGNDRSDALGAIMGILVGFIGWVVVRYARRYLAGEPRQRRFFVALLITLASVSIVVDTDHLVVLLLAWSATSLGLYRLLTFYPERPAALMAAHKKFIASRLAEVCMVAALVLVWHGAGTFSMAGLAAQVEALGHTPMPLQAAAFLIAVAVVLKSAQLPVHGWLIQVMEAPTPVSALLHAGIVNLGGFLLIRLAGLMSTVPAAQTLLIVVGGLTAALAGMVMMTRISIKVRLAWSTCAQMGFMLMECGLGLYELALLHLVAHSLYKAYAFLAAGDAVLDARRAALLPQPRPARLDVATRIAAGPLALGLVFATLAIWTACLPAVTVPPAALSVLGLGLAPLLWRGSLSPLRGLVVGSAALLVVLHLYLLWHATFDGLFDLPAVEPSALQTLWVAVCFGVLYAVQIWVLAYPAGRFCKAVYPWAYAGFHLDERFTRLTFRIWPMRLNSGVGGRRLGPSLVGEGS